MTPQAGQRSSRRCSSMLNRFASQIIAMPRPLLRTAMLRVSGLKLSTSLLFTVDGARVDAQRSMSPAAPVRNMGIELGRPQVSVAEHLLDAPEVGTTLEQVGGEGVAQEVRVHAGRVEPCLPREAPKDQEGTGAGERAPWALRKSSGRWRRSRYGRPRAR